MSSEAIKQTQFEEPSPESNTQGSWKCARWENDRYQILSEDLVETLSILEFIEGPYLLRMDLPAHGRVYFVGLNDELYHKFKAEGKKVLWILELIDGIWCQLVKKGLPVSQDISNWTIRHVWNLQATLKVFPEAQIMEVTH